MAKQKLLSNQTVDDVLVMLDWFRRNAPLLGEDMRSSYRPGETGRATTYVAEVPSGGIPARDGSVPGRTTCNIWTLVPSVTGTGTDPSAELEPLGTAEVVYNLSRTKITAGFVLIDQIKAGEVNGFVVDNRDADEETGTGTGTGTGRCISMLDGHTLANLGTGIPTHVLGIDSDGCLIKVPVGSC